MHFNTRTHAGKLLAKTLAKFLTKKYPDMDAVIYALPRGDVPLGFEIALALDMPLDLIIPRKMAILLTLNMPLEQKQKMEIRSAMRSNYQNSTQTGLNRNSKKKWLKQNAEGNAISVGENLLPQKVC